MIHEDIQYCLGMVLAGEGDLDRGVKEKSSVILPSPLKKLYNRHNLWQAESLVNGGCWNR